MMTLKRERVSAKLVVVALTVSGGLISGGSAVAHDIDNCGQEATCIWAYNNYQNRVAQKGEGDGAFRYVGDAANNRNSSWANNSENMNSCGADYLAGDGDRQTWAIDGHDPDQAPWNDNEVSSWRTQYGC
ncbi:hypothetical protein K8W59_01650 [Nocardioides rotundus]|uniref:hypothetical protein n=1 Tax=Nocardioides rotundus TaxID=1774216 RepID=UPI001CC10FBE|nr:hypothetical protein [Nocardioides rotundus]UAL30278.1 hypothetical protein K8W59_01650 [Nocardioides rotundus]